MKKRIYLNDEWGFAEEFSDALLHADCREELTKVRIPHTCKELPFHYFDESEYQMLCGYARSLEVPKEWKGKKVFLTFEGAAHDAAVYVNGKPAGEHHCGYTAFTLEIGELLEYGKENWITVKLDTRESLDYPPFGFVIDYMTYGGIYRDVYLEVKEPSYISDVFVSTRLAGKYSRLLDLDGEETVQAFLEGEENDVKEAVKELCHQPEVMYCLKSKTESKISLAGISEGMKLRQSLRMVQDGLKEAGVRGRAKIGRSKAAGTEFRLLGEVSLKEGEEELSLTQKTGEVELWDIDHPALYEVKTELFDQNGVLLDESCVTFGYRKAVFHKNGFYLNGRKVKLRGLNRHQSYPYVGYAMPDSMQVHDADILKDELGLNAVRTSHYPQSHSFLRRCDERGLLVFTEFPGWQHIGGDAWKNQAVENVKDMIVQYRNHPSIFLWGVRINESVDDDAFYARTNAAAHRLDPTRATGGVRCYKKGSFQEDVFTYNDFSHDGKRAGCEKKSAVTSDMGRAYLISEYNGHMYPTKNYDWEEHRMEHAKRHANVLESVAEREEISGSFGWCMFDYNTHKDFGSGDRICYHGVMDMFRNPKLAAVVYAMQQEDVPVLEISSTMDIGEHPGCNRGDVYIYTNADSVRMYKNEELIKEYQSRDTEYKHLPHGPIRIDDYIGEALEKNESMSHEQAEDVKALLNEVARVGLYGMSKSMYLKAGKLMVQYKMKMSDAVELFNRYIGDWGGASKSYKFEAIKNGEVVKTIYRAPMKQWSLQTICSHTDLKEGKTYDVAEVRIWAVDEYGNILPFANDPLKVTAEGAISLIGPELISLQGGMSGVYVKTTGKLGIGKLTIQTAMGHKEEIEFWVEEEKE